MSLKYLHACSLVGKDFPLDMLRYDQCWPMDIATVHSFVDTLVDKDVPQVARLMKYSEHADPSKAWAVARWRSFGWEFHETQVKKI